MTAAVLDDLHAIRALDPANMYNRIFDFPEQMASALKIIESIRVPAAEFSGIRNIVCVGMGGSAIGGDLVRSLLSGTLMIPFHICRNYTLPEFVDDETLVIVSSYSGNTEETLAALDDALARKALVVGLTTGGILEEVAKLNEFPLIVVPSGMQPRAALGYSFVPILIFLEKIGLVKGQTKELQAAIKEMQIWREAYIEDLTTEENPAKKLASLLAGRMPIIYGGAGLTEVVSVRWKGQLCENAKVLSFANQFPEWNHNELVGWCELVRPHKDHLAVIMLHDTGDHPRISRRTDIARAIIERTGVPVYDIQGQGTSPIARMFSLIQLGDFTSYYLAILNKVDPTPVAAIETLKRALADSR